MKRLIFTLFAGVFALAIMGFAYVAVSDAPVAQHEIVKSIPTTTDRTTTP